MARPGRGRSGALCAGGRMARRPTIVYLTAGMVPEPLESQRAMRSHRGTGAVRGRSRAPGDCRASPRSARLSRCLRTRHARASAGISRAALRPLSGEVQTTYRGSSLSRAIRLIDGEREFRREIVSLHGEEFYAELWALRNFRSSRNSVPSLPASPASADPPFLREKTPDRDYRAMRIWQDAGGSSSAAPWDTAGACISGAS